MVPNWECPSVHRKQALFLSVYVDDIFNGWNEAEYGSNVEDIGEERWSWRTNFISWSRMLWGVLNVNANRMKQSLNSIGRCLNHECLLEQLKSYQGGKSLTQKQSRGPTTRKDMLEYALSDTVNWQTKKVEQLYKV